MPDGPPDTDAATPLERYRALREANEIMRDPAQKLAVEKLQSLHHALTGYQPAGDGWLSGWKDRFGLGRRTEDPPMGLYIYGPVGRGKSMLTDLFFETAPVERKRRVHFHAFMLEVQKRLTELRKRDKQQDPLMRVAAEIADESWLLCFDEFHVVNIADAMILGRLFQAFFDHGVVVVATSNVAPRDLYRGGLQRDRFLPFIDLILQKLDVLDIGEGRDFRLDRLKGEPVWHTPLGPEAEAQLDKAFATLTDNATPRPQEIELQGRKLVAERTARGIARFTFDELCRQPRGAADYLAISECFHTVMIEGIPRMEAKERDAAKRFVILVDSLYENKVNLFATAEVAPEELYTEGDTAFEFERTVSRLMEMQAEDYLNSRHLS
ncbi:MAG: AFG1 family ATPase [Alphaproteobacteria bacterium]|nr:AFG1 family ATPase [Alphaproteobacteria bacterium]